MSDVRIPIQGFIPDEVAQKAGCDLTTARKVCGSVHQRGEDELGTRVPKMARRADVDAIASTFRVGRLQVVERVASQVDPFVKYILKCEDDSIIETVRIPLEKTGRFGVCVSSQVGCALGCTFCATGRMGLKRNLEVWEIIEQIRVIRRDLPPNSRVHSVVFQGMGEPLSNVDRVIRAVQVMRDPCGCAINERNITVCTSGLPSGIRKLTEANLKVRLGLSLGSAQHETRKRLMPIESVHPLSEVVDAAAEYVKKTGYSPMFAITPLRGQNTTDADADAVAELSKRFVEVTGSAPRLSLIPYNSIGVDARTGESDPYERATEEEAEHFRLRLRQIGVPVVRRYSGGGDVGAACGQLATETGAKPRR